MWVRRHRPWNLPDREITDEAAWLGRRELIRNLGLGSLAVAAGACGPRQSGAAHPIPDSYAWPIPPAPRNPSYVLDRPMTDEVVAATHNNYYEFTMVKDQVWTLAHTLPVRPWTIDVRGEVHEPGPIAFEDLVAPIALEERAYRFRCVEAWSMAVPWIGFPLRVLLDRIRPTSHARFIRFVTLDAPDVYPGVKSQPWYPWPYYEALTLAEASNPLAFVAVGIYGHALPNQHGAPIRLVVPWKYGYKNIKSIAAIELVRDRPRVFWEDVASDEYDFWGNVRPDIPHPRWSQATERLIPSGRRVPTLMYNGYADDVAALY